MFHQNGGPRLCAEAAGCVYGIITPWGWYCRDPELRGHEYVRNIMPGWRRPEVSEGTTSCGVQVQKDGKGTEDAERTRMSKDDELDFLCDTTGHVYKAKSVSKHEWLQSPSPQGPKIAKERWGAVNELDSHTVRLRCIQYSMRQYMVGPEFLTQATPERLGERIEQAAEGKHSQGIRMDRRRLQSVKMLNIVMMIGELDSDDQIEVGEMTQGIMRNGGKKTVG
ncbi:hypothetical protein GGX14DRAFT_406214 [Mycena pura]|uniref:Uncharacterized protein n=1 Tax=Mycena pura TaxID=153505 RepID=A0AAD6UQS8_9AGAR|nr:hypothetical protein GGX14DRAFT_406214 [Mycena pura]